MNFQINSLTGVPESTLQLPSLPPLPASYSSESISYNDNKMIPYLPNISIIVIIAVVIIAYFSLFSSLGVSSDSSDGTGIGTGKEVFLFEIILWGLFVFLVLVNGLSYFFNINISSSVKNILSDVPVIELEVKKQIKDEIGDISSILEPTTLIKKKEVFHLPNNKYTYNDSKAICKAYGGRLATYKEINDSYENGADWCSYGWSDGQMILYPTQNEKWEKLQNIPGHENDCGRPGINGGYIGNPEVRFGVNCFGYKPTITKKEMELMKVQDEYPKTTAEIEFDKKVNYWKHKLHDILVAPFNHSNWNMF